MRDGCDRNAAADDGDGNPEPSSAVGDAAAWKVAQILRGHTDDVQDLCWSPDATMILSGSVDNTAIVWDANTGKIIKRLTDHKHYVQGVSWDPLGKFLVTQSGDRTCRVYSDQPQTKRKYKGGGNNVYYCHHVLHKRDLVVANVLRCAAVLELIWAVCGSRSPQTIIFWLATTYSLRRQRRSL